MVKRHDDVNVPTLLLEWGSLVKSFLSTKRKIGYIFVRRNFELRQIFNYSALPTKFSFFFIFSGCVPKVRFLFWFGFNLSGEQQRKLEEKRQQTQLEQQRQQEVCVL